MRIMIPLLLACLVLVGGAPAQDPDVEELIERLESNDVSERDAATVELEKLGESALKPLRRARKEADDQEVRLRLDRVIEKIEVKHSGLARIVFCRGRGTEGELYLWEEGKVRQLTKNKLLEATPVLSPDGNRVAYFTMTTTDQGWRDADLVVKDLATGKDVGLGKGIEPVWSPDGKQIAFGRDREIHVIGADGKGDKVVFRAAEMVRDPMWSPDGKEIAYEQDNVIHIVDVAAGKSRKAVGPVGGAPTLMHFVWSHDGTRFALISGRGPYIWNVYTVDADGRNLTPRSKQGFMGHGNLAWSPVSEHVAACIRLGSGEGTPDAMPDGFDTGLHVIDVKTGNRWKAAEDVDPSLRPRWSPDGKWILFVTRKGEIWIAGRSGHARMKLDSLEVPYGAGATWFAPDAHWKK